MGSFSSVGRWAIVVVTSAALHGAAIFAEGGLRTEARAEPIEIVVEVELRAEPPAQTAIPPPRQPPIRRRKKIQSDPLLPLPMSLPMSSQKQAIPTTPKLSPALSPAEALAPESADLEDAEEPGMLAPNTLLVSSKSSHGLYSGRFAAALSGQIGGGRGQKGAGQGKSSREGAKKAKTSLIALSDLSRPPSPKTDIPELLEKITPRKAKEWGLDGRAQVSAIILSSGRVGEVRVLNETEGAGFGRVCVRALGESKWRPPLDKKRRRVAVRIHYDCQFVVVGCPRSAPHL